MKNNPNSERNQALLQAALDYAARGLLVLPVYSVDPATGRCRCGKPDCSSPGKHPLTAHGVKDATRDRTTIENWWRARPDANVGVATGAGSGIVVLDVDPRHGGDKSLTELEKRYGKLPATSKTQTGGGGLHLVFKHPGETVKNRVNLCPGIDIRGDGGYIVAPPSLHANGKEYEWIAADSFAPLPSWLLELVNSPQHEAKVESIGERIRAGQRNDTLFRLGCSLRARGLSEEAILAALLEENKLKCDPPLSEREVQSIASSAARYPAGGIASAEIQYPKPVAPEALYGLAGDFVRAVEPHTEADPVALLAHFLTAFGNVAGRNRYFQVEQTKHFTNLYVVLVGETSKGRKGTAADWVRFLFKDDNIKLKEVEGLSSGEGLIWQVRNPITSWDRKKKEETVTDPGIADKRLLIIETEFSSALKVLKREGNTLSPILRRAWDTGDLQALTKNSPAQATGAHISIVGHITRDELCRHLDETEMANGFANRIIWLCVKRSRVLPLGGNLDPASLEPLRQRLVEAVDFARSPGELRFDEEARQLWYQVYPELSEGKPGLVGAIISRAEAQVIRLACIYALLDKAEVIRAEHLCAALALWDYSEESARYIFRDMLGDPVADRILAALRSRPEGLPRSEIHNLFGRHAAVGRIDRALNHLVGLALARRLEQETGGRPVEFWGAI